jgi:hypothetical protein
MLGDMEMQYPATIMFQHEKYEQYLHRDGRHSKEIPRDHVADAVVQEGPPGLVRRAAERKVSELTNREAAGPLFWIAYRSPMICSYCQSDHLRNLNRTT